MINSKVFEILNSSNAVKALLGSNHLRVYPWGRAPQNPRKPYVVYNMYNAVPENYINNRPDIDNKGTQINIYSDDTAKLESCYIAVRDALEGVAHMTSFQTVDRDEDTDLYSVIMDFDFWENR